MVVKSKNLRIQSSLKDLYLLEAFVEDICYEYNIFNSYYGNIQVALFEAFENARVHGNGNKEEQFIDVSFYADYKGLHFTVKNEGVGFDYQVYTDIDFELMDEAHADKRGLLLIQLLADEVHFHDHGKQIEMIFYISSINYSLTISRQKGLSEYFAKVTSKHKVK